MENLTDKDFWIKYWLSKSDIYKPISKKYNFSDLFDQINKNKHPKTAIEIGGFPGFYSIFLKKFYNIHVSLIDIVIINEVIEELLKINNLPIGSIQTYESDVFYWSTEQKFDLVYSNGFIEHFDDTLKIIQLHTKFLNNNGTVLITLPNFKSLNGWFQKVFDKENYNKHNILCMDVNFLKNVAQNAGLENVRVFYYGYFSIWLEEKAKKKLFARYLRLILFYPLKVIFKILKMNNKYFSPYIVLIGEKTSI